MVPVAAMESPLRVTVTSRVSFSSSIPSSTVSMTMVCVCVVVEPSPSGKLSVPLVWTKSSGLAAFGALGAATQVRDCAASGAVPVRTTLNVSG
jgi:hypothetical protein